MRSPVTQRRAFDALANPAVPVDQALGLFRRAYRRANYATKDFTLHIAGVIRIGREDRSSLASWDDDGGARG